MSKEKIINDLNTNLFEKGVKTEILSEIGLMANSFGSLDKDLYKIVMTNDQTKMEFSILAAMCGMYMGYTYECETKYGTGHWDLRNEESSRYCYEHMDVFAYIFKDASGVRIQYEEDVKHQSFMRDCILMRKRREDIPLKDEITDFRQEHHTLQQKMMGTFIRILDEIYPKCGLEQVGFSFI